MRPSTLLANLSILGVVAGIGLADLAFAQDQDPRKDATEATKAANDRLLNELPFSDRSDFENAREDSSRRYRPR
jgi:alkyl sulfatase BDS1-like metallo-beta-lactamase superfamily hydrolase